MKQKLKRIFKRTVPLILVCSLTIGAVLGHNTKEVKALTGVEEAALVTAIFLAYGYVTTRYFNDTDGANALKNDMEQAYEESRFKVLNGGASGGNGDEDPDDNDFEDTDGDGKITEKDIPQFKDISLPGKAAFALSANTAILLKPIVTKFVSNRFGKNISDANINKEINSRLEAVNKYLLDKNIDVSSYKYKMCTYWRAGGYFEVAYSNDIGVIESPQKHLIVNNCVFLSQHSDNKIDLHENYGFTSSNWSEGYLNSYYDYWFCNAPHYLNREDMKNNSRVDWVTPELQDTFDNKGNLELLPSFDPSASYSMASQQALQELLSNLANSSLAPTQQFDLVNKFIEGLKTSETPEPSPNPDPSPEPTPNPKPDPDPEPGENEDNGKFTADLKTLFPFCIPFDLVDCFKLFNAEPETPRIEVPMHFDIVDVDYTWVIDLKDFDSVAVICRSMFLILFLIGLALATSKVIKW